MVATDRSPEKRDTWLEVALNGPWTRLEDAPLGETRSNRQLVEQTVRLISDAGSRPAEIDDVRTRLKQGLPETPTSINRD